MALNATDASQKTLANLEGTSDAKRLVEEAGADTINVYGPDVWTDVISPVPATAVVAGVAEERVLFALTEDVTVANQQAWRAIDGVQLRDFIGTKFGSAYEARFYDGNDALITKAQQIAQGFKFNYQTGILTIDGNAGAFVQPFKISAFRYTGLKGNFGSGAILPIDDDELIGGYRALASVTERDAIQVGERKEGMLVFTAAEQVRWRLLSDLTTWVVDRDYSPAPTTLYVDPENGSDGDTGLSTGTALATIQEACDRLFPSRLFPRRLEMDEVLEIVVLHTPGMDPVTEEVVKPAHAGPGQLRIRFEVEVVEDSLVQDGALSAVADNNGLHQIDFTTSPLTAGALTDGYWVTPDDPIVQGGAENVAFVAGEYGVIVDNGVDSAQVLFLNPGILDAFAYFDTAPLRVVRPQIQWTRSPDPGLGFGPLVPLFTNLGGMVVIEGAIFDSTSDFFQRNMPVVASAVGSNLANLGQPWETQLTLCRFENWTRPSDQANLIEFASCYFDTGTTGVQFLNALQLGMVRCLFDFTGEVETQFVSCRRVDLRACRGRSTANTSKFQFLLSENLLLDRCDFRDDLNLRLVRSRMELLSCTFEDMGNPAVELLDQTFVQSVSNSGSSGNSSYGFRLYDQCKLVDFGPSSVSGASGDVLVGATAASWSGGRTTDATVFSVAELN